MQSVTRGVRRASRILLPPLRGRYHHMHSRYSPWSSSSPHPTHAAVFPVLSSFTVAAIAYAEAAQRDRSQPALPPSASKPPPFLLSRYAVADAVEQVIPSVVNIQRVVTRRKRSHFMFEPQGVDVSCGSGFFISEDGHILTNSHVVSDPDEASVEHSHLQVTLSTGEAYVAKIVASDKASDIAIIKINTENRTPKAKIGNSDHLRPGEFVVAVGSPLTLSNSCSFGIVSTIHRDLMSSTGTSSGGLTYLQLDMAINQGSSGGPCISLDGEVIGICSMKIAGDAEGIAFAIPIKYAEKVVEDLQQHGFVRRPFVGLTLISVTPHMFEDIRKDTNYRPPRWLEAEMRNTNSAKSLGLMVHTVTKGGPGDQAGLKAGDVVVAVNEMKTTTTCEFLAALNFQVHQDCVLNVRRGASGREERITIRPDVLRAPDRLS